MLPTISLVTPSYNQGEFLGATLASVISQAYPRLEYVVVDGGSIDTSREIISAQGSRLAWWCSEPDGGLYAALNKGFGRTNGEIMGWLNSDDLHFPWTLRTVGEIFFRFPAVQWLTSLSLSSWTRTGGCIGVESLPGYAREAFLDGAYLPGARRTHGWIPQESTFWRRSLWEKAGAKMDDSLKLAGDFELWARFYDHAALIGTPSPLGGFRTHPAQKSRAMDSYLAEAAAALSTARVRHRHRTRALRSCLQRTRLADVPGLRGFCARCCGYTGEKIVASLEGDWRSESYAFL